MEEGAEGAICEDEEEAGELVALMDVAEEASCTAFPFEIITEARRLDNLSAAHDRIT